MNLEVNPGVEDARAGGREVVARARGAHEVCEPRDPVGVSPGEDVDDGVGARDEVELDVVRVVLAQKLERVDRVGDALAVHLDAAHEEARVVGRGQKRHGDSVLGRGDAAVLLEGGAARRHEDHDVEIEISDGLLGRDEVPVVDGIEGAAHDAQPVGAPGVLAHLRQVAHEPGLMLGREHELVIGGSGQRHARTCPLPLSRHFVVVRALAPMGPRT